MGTSEMLALPIDSGSPCSFSLCVQLPLNLWSRSALTKQPFRASRSAWSLSHSLGLLSFRSGEHGRGRAPG